MCGIAGVFGKSDPRTVNVMLDRLMHRGPDDGHVVAGDRFTLGARRLSIVDLAGGRQPLTNEDQTIWAAQNGELYNYFELKPKLIGRGHVLRTHCDTELIPHLYEEYGADLASRLDGMFAICLWDSKNQVGFLARDRTGKKPLYYLQVDGALYFASEIKALLTVPGFQRRVNLQAINHYLALKHVPAPLSIFEGIRVLPPAHTLVFRPRAEPVVRRYWSLDFGAPLSEADCSEEDAVDELLTLLKRGVRRRLMGDVPIGFFLSGGIDSSLSTVLAAEECGRNMKTFTLTFHGDATTVGKEDDRRWARWIAEKYQTDHVEESIHFKSFPDELRRIIGCFDEPFAGVISTYFLARRIGRHVKVAISGDGADELFGSYLSHRLAQPLANYSAYRRGGDAEIIRPFQDQPELLARLAAHDDWAWRAKLVVFTEAERQELYVADVGRQVGVGGTEDYWRRAFSDLSAKDPLNRVLEAEFQTIFPDQVLAFVDRLSMAHSLEVRSAFLDTEVMEFVAKLPASLKIRGGETKCLLKRAALRYFPEEMVYRKKEGFLLPITQWLQNDLEDYVRETLCESRLSAHGLFNPAYVGRLVERIYAGPCDYSHVNKVYALIVFQEWFDLYMR